MYSPPCLMYIPTCLMYRAGLPDGVLNIVLGDAPSIGGWEGSEAAWIMERGRGGAGNCRVILAADDQ